MRRPVPVLGLAAAVATLAATPALAHLDPVQHGSMLAGFTHPIGGLDHILAMLAVGLWAAMSGGRAVGIVPAAFVGTMTVGFAIAMAGAPLPFVEPAILASVVALGLLVAAAVRLPAASGASIVGLFALFHGHAHGGEIGAATALPYLGGFVVATALIHGLGIGLGLLLSSIDRRQLLARGAGAATAVAGTALFLGAI